MKDYLFKTERIGFCKWEESDLDLALLLWRNPDVMKLLSAEGQYSDQQVKERLKKEIENDQLHHVQYWKLYNLHKAEFMGCCGLKPYPDEENTYELGFQLLPQYWGKGYASEAAIFSLEHALEGLKASNVYAGHHPDNESSKKLLMKLGFKLYSTGFYEPTGLLHPLYRYYEI